MRYKYFVFGLTLILFIIALSVRIYLANRMPLWLDEQYSLYFAKNYSYAELMSNIPDNHLGGYYILVKFFSNFTSSIFALRLLTSIVPLTLFISIGYIIIQRYSHKFFLAAIVFTSVYFPITAFSWQLRPHALILGISFLASSICISKVNKKVIKIITSITLTLASVVSLPLWLSLVTIYTVRYKSTSLMRWIVSWSLISLLICFLFIGKGYKQRLEYVSWSGSVNFFQIAPTTLSVLGLGTTHGPQSTNIVPSLVLLTVLGSSALFLKRRIVPHYSFTQLNIVSSCAIYGLFFLTSFILQFSNKFPVLWKLLPQTNFFYPRALLTIGIFLSIFFLSYLHTKKWFVVQNIFLFTLGIVSIVGIFQLPQQYMPKTLHQFYHTTEHKVINIPYWSNLYSIQDPNAASELRMTMTESQSIELDLAQRKCPNSAIIIQNQGYGKEIDVFASKVEEGLNKCCLQKIEKLWICTSNSIDFSNP